MDETNSVSYPSNEMFCLLVAYIEMFWYSN